VPTLAACARTDMLVRWHDEVAALIPNAEKVLTDGVGSPEAVLETCAAFRGFLDR
jgi:hypothetical protein